MIKKIDHIVITTSNIDACLDFYKALGFQVEEDFGCYVLYAGDFKINVHFKGKERLPHAQAVTCGSGDFCFELRTSLEVFQEQLQKKDISIECGIVPRNGVKGTMHSLYVRDPDGNLLEFCSYEERD